MSLVYCIYLLFSLTLFTHAEIGHGLVPRVVVCTSDPTRLLRSVPFCDRAMSLGVNFSSLSKILNCAGNNNVMTMKAEDDADSVAMLGFVVLGHVVL